MSAINGKRTRCLKRPKWAIWCAKCPKWALILLDNLSLFVDRRSQTFTGTRGRGMELALFYLIFAGTIALFYLIFAGAIGFIASQRGRYGAGWFLLALVISPIIAVIVLALIPSRNAPARSLQDQVKDQLLERWFARYISKRKPAFAYSVVYDVNIDGDKSRFRSKAEAIAFCFSRLPPDPAADRQISALSASETS